MVLCGVRYCASVWRSALPTAVSGTEPLRCYGHVRYRPGLGCYCIELCYASPTMSGTELCDAATRRHSSASKSYWRAPARY
eukprot:2069011-Rhodomonas_salina.1